MEPYNRFLPKKAGAVSCDRWYLALQTNVGVDSVVVGHIPVVQVVQHGIIYCFSVGKYKIDRLITGRTIAPLLICGCFYCPYLFFVQRQFNRYSLFRSLPSFLDRGHRD